ncbi:MAG: MjaI family restriction endonuclease [Thermotogota bacterium]
MIIYREVILVRTYDGFLLEKSVINDTLAKIFPNINFEESDSDLDHAGDIDYLGYVGNLAFGIQIKPVTAAANFGNYKISERMQANFDDFEEKYGGKAFIVFSIRERNKKGIKNTEVIEEIKKEIERLKAIQ